MYECVSAWLCVVGCPCVPLLQHECIHVSVSVCICVASDTSGQARSFHWKTSRNKQFASSSFYPILSSMKKPCLSYCIPNCCKLSTGSADPRSISNILHLCMYY